MNSTQIKKISKELDHILGICKCKPNSKCIYWKLVDSADSGKAQKNAILKLIQEVGGKSGKATK